MQQKTAKKVITHEGMIGTIELTLFKDFNEDKHYSNNVKAYLTDVPNDGKPTHVYDEDCTQHTLQAGVDNATESIKNGIDSWHMEQQDAIIKSLPNGFEMCEEILLKGNAVTTVDDKSSLIVEEIELNKSTESISAKKNGNEPIASVDDVTRDISVDVDADATVDDW